MNLTTIEVGDIGDVGEICEIGEVGLARSTRKTFRWQVAAIGLGIGLMFVLGYVAYQRLGTNANASLVEYNKNLSGGFLAIAFSEDQPGFLVLSAIDADQVDVQADQLSNFLAGTYTLASIKTASDQWRGRLRNPQAITIDKSGHMKHATIDISLDEINRIRDAVDCSHIHQGHKRRCGAPFSDFRKALNDWPTNKIPEVVTTFLARRGLAN